jgi:hypothetical protein
MDSTTDQNYFRHLLEKSRVQWDCISAVYTLQDRQTLWRKVSDNTVTEIVMKLFLDSVPN